MGFAMIKIDMDLMSDRCQWASHDYVYIDKSCVGHLTKTIYSFIIHVLFFETALGKLKSLKEHKGELAIALP